MEKNVQEVVDAWKTYVDELTDWQTLIAGTTPKITQCGPVYELPSPLPGRTETFAISDMRGVSVATPHYHLNGETEIYLVVQGTGLTVMGGEEVPLQKGSAVVTPPNTAHFTIPEKDLVMVVINTPSFNAENIVDVADTDSSVQFDKAQYDRLTKDIASTEAPAS